MSNSFPSMISNEPPPLDQTDDEDEDSGEFRDFASGLKLDVDPSPMSTPRKEGKDSLPVHNNGSITPDSVLDSKDCSVNPSPIKIPESNHQQPEEIAVSTLLFPGFSSGPMKTSYIGTVDAEEAETCEGAKGDLVCDENSISESKVPYSPADDVCEDTSRDFKATESVDDSLDDFKNFQTSSYSESTVEPSLKTDYSDGVCNAVGELNIVQEGSGSLSKDSQEKELEDDPSLSTIDIEVPASASGDGVTVSLDNVMPDSSDCIKMANESQSSSPDEASSGDVSSPVHELIVSTNETPQSSPDTVELQTETNAELGPPPPNAAAFTASFSAFDDDDDFEDFQVSAPVKSTSNPSSENSPDHTGSQLQPQTITDPVDDEFPDFQANFSAPETNEQPTTVGDDGNNVDDGDDEFDDFQEFQSTSTVSSVPCSNDVPVSASTVASAENFNLSRRSSSLQDKFDALVKNLFILDCNGNEADETTALKPIDKKLKDKSSGDLWNKVEDFEGSQGLVFKWPNSVAHQRLLGSLKIDTSTIVYSGKWGPIEVPRFAASIVDAPLKPENITNVNGSSSVIESPTSAVSNGSNDGSAGSIRLDDTATVMNAMNSSKSNGRVVSQEAQQIINQLPDLSFMRAKTLVFPSPVVSSDA